MPMSALLAMNITIGTSIVFRVRGNVSLYHERNVVHAMPL